MAESDIPLFIGCELAGRLAADFNREKYVGREFLDAASPVMEVLAHLSKVETQSDELACLLVGFVSHVDGKYKLQHRSIRWERLFSVGSFADTQQLSAGAARMQLEPCRTQ